jgi:thymidylate kinase
MKKIAYVGAHSSAKTTTVNRLSQFLKDEGIPFVVVTEVPRDCPFPINKESGYKAQQWMVMEHVRRELDAREKANLIEQEILKDWSVPVQGWPHAYIICDRSLWDYVAYSRSLNEKGMMTDAELKAITDTVRGMVEVMPYYRIYFCEMKPPYDDGIRDTDPEWQREIYDHFKRVIKDYSLKVIVVQ